MIKHFGGFGFKFGHNGFYKGPGDYKKMEKGGWYQKLKEFLNNSTEKLKKMVSYVSILLGDNDCPNLNPFNDFSY